MDQLLGIIWEVTKFLCGCSRKEADYIYNLEENLQSLGDKWKNLTDIKQDVEAKIEVESTGEMRRTQLVNGWLQQIEDIPKEVEDIIAQGDSEIRNKCLCERCPKNCVSSYKLGKKIAKMLKDVDGLLINGEKFINKDVEITHKLSTRAIEMPLEETVGFDLMFKKVWNSIEAEDVGVIGLYGMGGAGKTTLSKRINNELVHRRPDFNVVMWIVVSKDLNFNNVMDNIRKKVGIGDDTWKGCSNQDEKAAKIYRVLKQKKFVLILDDIWEQVDLDKVGVPHPKDANFQSKVLFTTRFEDVCDKMNAQRKFKVECLNEKEAFELFCKKVGEDTLKSHPDIPKLAEEIAVECDGLPLALIVIGCAMSGKKSLEAWEHSKNNLKASSWTALNLETKVFSILKFSYDQLPDETHKNCFLYCALYPEDYKIIVPDLIEKWIGEGFLEKNTTKSLQNMRDHGGSVIENLKLSCLLESVEDDSFWTYRVKMHDVIRDMALWLARDQDKNPKKVLVERDASRVSQNNVETRDIVERVSIITYDELHVPVTGFPNLTTLIFESHAKITGLSNIQYMKKLRVLHLKSFRTTIELPAEIGGLVFLECLSVGGDMWVSKFPMELKNLKNLKLFSLEISGGDLVSIPLEVISSLEQLRLLRFTTFFVEERSTEEMEFLEKLESLRNLEELWIVLKTENGIKKLLESTKLQSCIRCLRLNRMDTQINIPLLLVGISKMKHLQEIVFDCSDIMDLEDYSVFASCSLRMLRTVFIRRFGSATHMTWLKYAPLLQSLTIMESDSLEEVIKEEIEDDKGRENMDNIFSSLVTLHLYVLRNLKCIHKTALSFPSLTGISIDGCPKLKRLPFDSSSGMDKLKLIDGGREWWDNLEWEDPAIKDKLQSKFGEY